MNYLLDTNIIITYLRQNIYSYQIDQLYNPLGNEKTSIISVVSIGEIKSIGLQNNWGKKKGTLLNSILRKFLIADINVKSIVNRYAEIDTFSQGKLKNTPLSMTSRNMGKNDLWIAATASVLNAKLLTTDNDFDHLNGIFLEIEKVELIK